MYLGHGCLISYKSIAPFKDVLFFNLYKMSNFSLVTRERGAYVVNDVRVLIDKLTKCCQNIIDFLLKILELKKDMVLRK